MPMPHRPSWKGGKWLGTHGYVYIWIAKDDFFYPMAGGNGYILEHRLVMAQSLGRCLQPWELVHHKNGIRDENQRENLELTNTLGGHIRDHSRGYKDGYDKGLQDGKDAQVKRLQTRISILEQRVTLLEANKVIETLEA